SVKPRWRERPSAARGSFGSREGGPYHSGASQQLPLGGGHPTRVGRGLMIVAAAVQDAVREKAPELGRARPSAFFPLSPSGVEGDDHVSENAGFYEWVWADVRQALLPAH